jgi:formylglycine-generating enzyme required for sulfatase activity
MHGNVWEWAADFFDATYPAGQVTDPTGPFQQKGYRVKRGGSWKDGGTLLRSAKRWHNQASTRKSEMGFRVALRQVGK